MSGGERSGGGRSEGERNGDLIESVKGGSWLVDGDVTKGCFGRSLLIACSWMLATHGRGCFGPRQVMNAVLHWKLARRRGLLERGVVSLARIVQ